MSTIRRGVDDLDQRLKEGLESIKKIWKEAQTTEKIGSTETNGVSTDQTQTARDTQPTTLSALEAVRSENAGPATADTLPKSRSETTAKTALVNLNEAKETAEGPFVPLMSLPELASRHSTVLFQHAEFLDSLNLKIDNLNDLFSQLTTDRLAQLMLGQLSQVFPHASTIQSSFEQLGRDLAGLDERSHSMAKQLEELGSTMGRVLDANSRSEADRSHIIEAIGSTHSCPSATAEAAGQELEPGQAEQKQRQQDPNRGRRQPSTDSADQSNKGEGSADGKQGVEAEEQDQIADKHQLTGTADDLLRELQKCISEMVVAAQGTAEGIRLLEAHVASTWNSTVDEFAVVNILLETLYAHLGIEMTRPVLPVEDGNDRITATAVEAATSTHNDTTVVTTIEAGTTSIPTAEVLGNGTTGNGGAEIHHHHHQRGMLEQAGKRGSPGSRLDEHNEGPDNEEPSLGQDNGELSSDGDNDDPDFDLEFDEDSEEIDMDEHYEGPQLLTETLTKRKRRDSSYHGPRGGDDINNSDGHNNPKSKRTRTRQKARATISSGTESDSSNKDTLTPIKSDGGGHMEDKDKKNKGKAKKNGKVKKERKVEKSGTDNGDNDCFETADDDSDFPGYH